MRDSAPGKPHRQATPGTPTDLLTRPEAANFLRVSVSTLERWALQGTGPVITRLLPTSPRGPVRYRRSDLEAFVEAGRFASTSQYHHPLDKQRT